MHSISIQVKNLSKEYQINVLDYKSFKKDLINFFGFKKIFDLKNNDKNNKIDALKDLNFEINKGDIVGLVGENGAGKSTFLKILSDITEPSNGEINYSGKLIAMLTLNAGLAGECTAKENIYFLASMYGYSKNEIDEKFIDILKFAEIEKFIDTPMKKFSSGMTTRLVFSTVANFKPDILVADEILANSDENFKFKCVEKLKELNSQGTTILFVSHEEKLVKNLCTYGIFFNKGTTSKKIDIDQCFNFYNELKRS